MELKIKKCNKKIFFISYGAGGAETINPIYHKVKDKFKIVKNIAISKYAAQKLKDCIYIDEEKVLDYIIDEKPDAIINERANGLIIQNRITKLCKGLKIFNICLLDLYGNYQSRFTEIPDIIISPGESITSDLINFGISREIIYTLGNPAFDRLSEYKYNRESALNKAKILFASQPLDACGYDVTQYKIFDKFYKETAKVYKDFTIDIKLHPMENNEKWNEICSKYRNVKIIDFSGDQDFLAESTKYDIIAGYNSTIMLQTYIIGIPTVFYESEGTLDALKSIREGKGSSQYIKYGDFKKNAVNNVSNRLIRILADSK